MSEELPQLEVSTLSASHRAEFGAEPFATTPEELARLISADLAKWREIIATGGIRVDP